MQPAGLPAPVAQRIRASHCGCEGQRFESSRAYSTFLYFLFVTFLSWMRYQIDVSCSII